MNEVAPNKEAIAIDARAQECRRYANEIRELEKTDRPEFDRVVAKLKKATIDEADTAIGDMAIGTLEELQIDSTEGLTVEEREEVLGVLLRTDGNEYMGNPEIFTSLEDAQRRGELMDDTI